MMNKELIYVIGQMATEKGIDKEILFEALESALLSASKKTMGVADNTRMELDRHTGALKVFARKKVVETVADPKLEIALDEARKLNAEAELEDEIEIGLPTQEFGRIAAQTAKQVILQRVRDAERDAVYSDFIDKQGKIIRGTVHRIEKRNVIVDLGKAEAVITEREQIPGERYNPNDRVRAFVQEVKKTAKGPQILLSRADAGFLVRLFEAEIPEIAEGIVQVKAAAREPGERAKVAVMSTKRDVDPIGAYVGLRGTRIQVISRELRSVLVIVPDNQLSLAIGKRGQNARLAAKLTGLHVDIRSEGEVEEERRLAEEELAQGREALATFAGVGPQLVERLVEHGLFSPTRIVQAGLEVLEAVPGLGEKKAAGLLAAAQEWLDQHPPAEPEQDEAAAESVATAEGMGAPEEGVGDTPPESMARTSAE